MVSSLGSVSNHLATTQNTLATRYQCTTNHTEYLSNRIPMFWHPHAHPSIMAVFMGRHYSHFLEKYKNVVMLSCSHLGLNCFGPVLWECKSCSENLLSGFSTFRLFDCLGVVVYRYLSMHSKKEKKELPTPKSFFLPVLGEQICLCGFERVEIREKCRHSTGPC